jgi:hypothetical protein
MLTIRKAQMAVFETLFARRFRENLKRHVRDEFPTQTQSQDDTTLDKLISDGITRGRIYEITTERDLTLFVDLLFLAGQDFDHSRKMAWARRILLDKNLDGTAKMQAICQRLGALENAAVIAAAT